MTHLGRAAPIHRFGISAPRRPGTPVSRPFGILAPPRSGTPATHSRCRGAVFALRHNVRDNGTMPVMNDEVPGEVEPHPDCWITPEILRKLVEGLR